MYLKQLLFTFFAITLLNLSAQKTIFIPEITFENNQTVDFSSLDYSKISDASSFTFYNAQLNSSELLYTSNLQSMLILEDVNEAQMAIALGQKFKRRHPMEKTGRILTYIGVPLAIIGGIMVAGADELYYECVNGDCSGDARGGFGIVLLGAGSGLSITGAVLWIVGAKK